MDGDNASYDTKLNSHVTRYLEACWGCNFSVSQDHVECFPLDLERRTNVENVDIYSILKKDNNPLWRYAQLTAAKHGRCDLVREGWGLAFPWDEAVFIAIINNKAIDTGEKLDTLHLMAHRGCPVGEAAHAAARELGNAHIIGWLELFGTSQGAP